MWLLTTCATSLGFLIVDVDALFYHSISAIGFMTIGLVLGAWGLSLKWKLDQYPKLRARATLPLAVLFVGLLTWGLVCPATQRALWNSILARNQAQNWFPRDVARIRLQQLDQRQSDAVIIGSSQAAAAFDLTLIRARFPDQAIEARTIGDLTPVRALMAQQYLLNISNNLAVLFLSERDIQASTPWNGPWMRPLVSWPGYGQFLRIQPLALIMANWRMAVDMGMAATFPIWKTRDFLRELLFAPLLVEADGYDRVQQHLQQALFEQREGLLQVNQRYLDLQIEALAIILIHLKNAHNRVIIMEGNLSPAAQSAITQQRKSYLREHLVDLAKRHSLEYYSSDDQPFMLGPEDWSDLTHVNTFGRAKYTAWLTKIFEWQGW